MRSDTRKDPNVEFEIPEVENLEGQTITMTRSRIYHATEEFIDRVVVMVRGVLNDLSIHPKSVQATILLGGASSYAPLLDAMTTATGTPPLSGFAYESVYLSGALGTDVLQASRSSQSTEVPLSASIGIALPGGRFKALVDAGTPLPTRVIRRNPTTKANQSEFELSLYQGDTGAVSDCHHLGTISLPGLPKGARGQVFVDLEISVQKDGVTRIVLSETQTNSKTASVVWTEQTPGDRREQVEQQAQAELADPEKQKGKKGLFGRLFGR